MVEPEVRDLAVASEQLSELGENCDAFLCVGPVQDIAGCAMRSVSPRRGTARSEIAERAELTCSGPSL
eukprot:2745265-Rhodomonas_salina.1